MKYRIQERELTLREQPRKRMKITNEGESEGRMRKTGTQDSDTANPKLETAVLDMMKLQCAPKPDLDEFTGDPLEYHYFRASFKEVVETSVPDQRGRLVRLIKYTSGDPKELIKHLVHADPDNCYDQATELLDKEYGNPHLISCKYIKELRNWEVIKNNDTANYKKLHRFLLKCKAYKGGDKLRELDSTDMIRTIICKLQSNLQERWNRKAVDLRLGTGKEATFDDLMKFMEREVTLMSDPAYSRDALSECSKQIKSFSTNVNPEAKNVDHNRTIVCRLCSAPHDIEYCDTYLAQGIDERHRTVFQQRLCFCCLEPVGDGHNGKSCGNKRKCMVCNGDHPTTLHGGKSMSGNSTSLEYNVISMCVVPVQLWHKDNDRHKIVVYALLDDSSQGTFIVADILEMLNLSDRNHEAVSVKTLNGIGHDPENEYTDGLVVQCCPGFVDRHNEPSIQLPRTYSRSFLAVDAEEIPTPSKIRAWDHLKVISDKIPDYDPAIPIGLMIGGNCPIAVEPREVVESKNGGPYGKRTRLGWGVVDPLKGNDLSKTIKSNHTKLRGTALVKDAATETLASHVFTVNNAVQDNTISNMLKEMYAVDFNVPFPEKEGMSMEDKKFINIMEEGVSRNNGHYELPLPFRNPEVRLPYNRMQVLGRLATLKRKLLANRDYLTAYNKFMQNLIMCKYARKADPSKDQPGKTWHVPHFGVFNPKKDKLRVVFDFSVKFKNRCLNDELIPGPNLSNLMLGVIIRFRKEPVAYMADIEAMFHQVFVPEEQRCYLRFLYWPEGRPDAEPEDYEMCVHPFGAVSSGSCANFALKKAAIDQKDRFGERAARALTREFYVDDHLNSEADVHTAKTLFEATRDMCAESGFNLTKLVSNSSELMELLPVECLSPSLVDLTLSKQQLPIERALGVFWCLENDTLQFRITFQDKPLNKSGVLGTIGSVYDPTGMAGPFILPGRKILQSITREKGGWQDELSPELRAMWEKWRMKLPDLQKIRVNRCYKPADFKTASCSLHSFSDASDYGYGQVTYLRQVSEENEVCVALVMAKSRVVPAKKTTIPRMELTAALVSAQVTDLVKEELDMSLSYETYWVDSTIVLGYIQNDKKRFRTFVANKQQKIRNLTEKKQWKYINTEDNPADFASRGISVDEKDKVHSWLYGPSMLWV